MRRTLFFSVVDQAVLSAFNFLLALMLIKYWSDKPDVFGVYAVVLAGALTLTSVQNALVLSHLTVLRPKSRDEKDESALLSMFWTVNTVVTIGAMGITFVSTKGALGDGDADLGLAAALYVGASLIREYTRCYHFSSLEVGSVLALDAASLALSAIGIAAAWHYRPPLTLDVLFLVLAGCQMVASVVAILPTVRHFRFSLGEEARRAYLTVWRDQSRWALLGVVATEFQQRGYVFVVALFFGTAHVALLQAAALVFRPVQLLTHAWGRLARVVLAGHFANGRHREARQFTMKSLGALAVIFFAFLGSLMLAWPYIKTHIFQAQFANLETICVLWAVATAMTITAGVFSLEAQSLIKFRELSFAAILGAVACGIVLAIAVGIGDFRGSILAVIAGQIAFLFAIHRIIAAYDLAFSKAAAATGLDAKTTATTSAPVGVRPATSNGHPG